MKYVVKRGYSYTDIHSSKKIYGEGETFEGVVDETQKWKLGTIKQQDKHIEVTTKGATRATQTKKAKTKTKK